MLYQKIKVFAKEKGVSISKLQKDCGLSSGCISKWDEVCPSFDKVVLVADRLEISLDELAVVYRKEKPESC